MRTWERTILFGIGTIFLVSVIVLLAFVLKGNVQKITASFPTTTGYEYQFFEMRLLPADLPSGYVRRNIPMQLAIENGVGEQYVYEANRSNSSVHLVQQIIIFPTVAAALEKIQIEIAERPKFEFAAEGDVRTRMSNADHLLWACSEPVSISGVEFLLTRYCITIASYNNVYVVLRGRVVEGKLLTMDKYLALLQLLDERVSTVQRDEVEYRQAQ